MKVQALFLAVLFLIGCTPQSNKTNPKQSEPGDTSITSVNSPKKPEVVINSPSYSITPYAHTKMSFSGQNQNEFISSAKKLHHEMLGFQPGLIKLAADCQMIEEVMMAPEGLPLYICFNRHDDIMNIAKQGKGYIASVDKDQKNNIMMKLMDYRDFVSKDVACLLLNHEMVHVEQTARNLSLTQAGLELPAYLFEIQLLKKLNTEWAEKFLEEGVALYNKYGFSNEVKDYCTYAFNAKSLSELESSAIVGFGVVAIAMQANGIITENADNVTKLTTVLEDLNKYFKDNGFSKY